MANLFKEEVVVGGQQLMVKERIAEGGFGFVDLVLNPNNGQEFVLKRCGIQRQESYDTVNKEITLLKRFRHRNIVHLIASEILTVSGKREAFLLLEYCPGGHLLQRLNARNGTPLAPSDVCRIFGQVLQGVQLLHESSPPVVHRDLKLENILQSSGGDVKLCDFGSCVIGYVPTRTPEEKSKAEEVISKETTQMYRAPEMVDLYMRDELTEKTDIWALGCILYCLCFISHPFQDAGNLGILSAKINMPQDSPVPYDMRELILKMLDMDAEARPSVQYLIKAMDALSVGNPIPEFELSDVAIQRKEERAAAAQRRANMSKKSNPNVVPARQSTAPLASNSVAARRLAAKRGGGSAGTELAGAIPHPGYAAPAAAAAAGGGGSADDLFFSDASPAGNASATAASLFDDFGSAPAPAPKAAASNDFDMFGSSVAPPAAPQKTAPAAASSNFFDTDHGFGAISPAAPAAKASAPVDLFGGNDLFGSAPPAAPAKQAPASNDFDMFSSPAAAPAASKPSVQHDAFGSSELLSSFTTAPPPSQAQKAASVLDLFQTAPPQQQQGYGRGPGGPAYDPFGGMGGGNMGGNVGRMPPQGGMPGYGARAPPPPQQYGQFATKPKQEDNDPFASFGAVKK